MQVNSTQITLRNERPGVLEKVGLLVSFIHQGSYFDPYAISSVSIFSLSSNGSPSSILNSDNLIASNVTPLFNFQNSSTAPSNVSFNTSNYSPGSTASGIYKLSTGSYIVILDGGANLSSVYLGSSITNSVSAIGDYLDVWTLKPYQSSPWETLLNNFHLYNDEVFTITEPLLLTTKNTLFPRQIKLTSKEELKVRTEITVGNLNITPEIRNIFRNSVIQNPQIKIIKINEGNNQLPNHVTVSSYTNTSSLIDTTADNTIVLVFDTNLLLTHSELLAGNMGSPVGTYAVQVKYDVINQTLVSNLMYFEVT